MNRIFGFEMAAKTGLMITLVLAVVFTAGCPRKQGKSSQTLPSLASSENKTPKLETKIQPPAAGQPKESALSKPAGFKPYESMHFAEEKIAFITKYADEHPGAKASMVYKVLDDSDVEVRKAAMEMLMIEELDDPNIIYVATKGLKDSEPEVCKSAIEACAAITDPALESVLLAAIGNSSQEVRTRAIQIAAQKGHAIRLPVLKAGIASRYEDVKEDAVSALVDAPSPAAMDILITGLKDSEPDFRNKVRIEIESLLSQKFDTYDHAKKWWDANRSKFKDNMALKD